MLIKHDSEVAPVGASVNRTAIVDIPQGPNVDEPGAATAAGRPTPYFLTSPPVRPDLPTTERRSAQSEARLDIRHLRNL